MALDHRQDIAEIMCNAGSEMAHRLHFLGLAELGLELQALRNIVLTDQRVRFGSEFNQFSGQKREAFLAGFGANIGFEVANRFVGAKFFENLAADIGIWPHANFKSTFADDLTAIEASHSDVGIVDVEETVVSDGNDGNGNRAGTKSFCEALFGKAQFAFGNGALGNFAGEALVGALKFDGALADERVEIRQLAFCFLGEGP